MSRFAFLIPASCLTGIALAETAPATAPRLLNIDEYRVEGVNTLPALEVEKTVYPFMGPSRTPQDVEAARAALEKAYQDKGYKTVSVVIPAQKVENGVVVLQVVEGKVGRLRVRGSQYTDLDEIKAGAPSLAEGKVPDFNEVQKDLVALNRSSDRQITPAMKPGAVPGTIDVDLEVKDELPLHGSLELNNRYNPDTKPLRVSGSLRYDNLWQIGHSVGASFQVAPERPDDSLVFSGYYLAKPVGPDWLSFMLQGTKQDSDVNTLGAFNVSGRGEVVGLRAIAELPAKDNFFHSLSLGVDYKHFDTDLATAGTPATQSPITYYPWTLDYTATYLEKDGSSTHADVGITWHFNGLGSDSQEFANKRYGSSGSFFYLRAELSREQKLPGDMELAGKLQAQATGQPLVSNEQFGIGGLSTVRGYLESEAVGDNGLVASAELRSPSFTLGGTFDEWRVYTFADWGGLTVNESLPGQQARFELASVGVGSRLRFQKYFNASVDVGVPLIDGSRSDKGDPRVTFRVWAEF